MDYHQIHAFAEKNYGLIDREHAFDANGSDGQIQHLLERKQWTQIHAGVYQVGSGPLTKKAAVRAASLAAGPRSLISHRTAAELWGLEGVRFPRIELTVPYLSRPAPEGVVVHRTRRPMTPFETAGIPVTSPERAILDTAAAMPTPIIETMYDSGIRKGIITPSSMANCLHEEGTKGVRGRARSSRCSTVGALVRLWGARPRRQPCA